MKNKQFVIAFSIFFQPSNPIKALQQSILHSLDLLFGKTNHVSHVPYPVAFAKESGQKIGKNFQEFQSLLEFQTQNATHISEQLLTAISNTNFQLEDLQSRAPNQSTNSQQTQEINPNMIYRQQAILRYKQKKLRANTKIAYECRKIVADSRPRLKGRFISKEEQWQIQSILDGTSIEKLLNEKKNINLKKIVLKAKLFTKIRITQKKINRESIQTILDRKQEIQQIILKKIQKKQQIFQIEVQ